MLQTDEPQIHQIHKLLLNQLTSILTRFIKPQVIVSTSDVTALDIHKKEHHKELDDITIGSACRTFIEQNVDQVDKEKFYTDVQQFYISSSDYMLKKYPYNDPLLLNAQVLDISKRTDQKFASVMYFVNRYHLIPLEDNEAMDELEAQFIQYQVDQEIVYDPEARIDEQWHKIGKLRNVRNQARYGRLELCYESSSGLFSQQCGL